MQIRVIASVFLLAASSQAATFTYTSSFDSTPMNGLTAPFVGSGTLSYNASSQLADGNYAWSTLINTYGLTMQVTFTLPNSATTTFTQSDLIFQDFASEQYPFISAADLTAGVHVQLTSGEFYFTNTTSTADHPGSANFINTDGYFFSNEPISNSSISTFRGSSFDYPLFTLGSNSGATQIYMGDYGASAVLSREISGGGSVPEPSTYGLIGLGALGVAIAARRRKLKTA